MARRYRTKPPEEKLSLLRQMRTMRSVDAFDPNFKRLEYIRYADDFIVMVSGSRKDAQYIKNNIKDYLKVKCGLELNTDKTIISNIGTEK